MTAPRLSIIIPHYNDLENLDACLSLLAAQSLPAEAYEVIVADNASPVGLAAVAAVAGTRARVVLAEEKGAGPARNAGAAAATGAVLAFTDSDCRPASDWAAQALAAAERSAVSGGRVTVLPRDPAALTAAEAFEAVFAFDNRAYIERKGFSVTANLVVRRPVFEQVGPFRAAVSEDVDWCRRAAAAGFPVVYAADLVVGHPARRTWAELRAKWDRTTREGFLLMREQPGGRLRWALRAGVVLVSPLAHTPKVLRAKALPAPADRLKALAMLYRLRLHRVGYALRLLAG